MYFCHVTESSVRVRECISFKVCLWKGRMRVQYFMYTPVKCLDLSYLVCTRITSHAFSCIYMTMSFDVCSIDVLLHAGSTHLHLSRHHVCARRHCDGFKSLTNFFLPPPHRTLKLHLNSLSVLPADIFSGLFLE